MAQLSDSPPRLSLEGPPPVPEQYLTDISPSYVEPLGSDADAFDLTGQELLLYVSSRLSSLDQEIGSLMGRARDAVARKQYVNEVKAWADDVTRAVAAKNDDAVDQLMDEFPAPPAGLEQLGNDLYRELPGRSEFSADTLAQFQSRLDGVLDEINGQSEIDMLRVNHLLGQRSVCLQMASGVMKECNDGRKAIVGNV